MVYTEGSRPVHLQSYLLAEWRWGRGRTGASWFKCPYASDRQGVPPDITATVRCELASSFFPAHEELPSWSATKGAAAEVRVLCEV